MNHPTPSNPHVRVRESSLDDCEMAQRFRRADLEELNAVVGEDRNKELLLCESIKISDQCFTAEYQGRPSLIFGVSAHPAEEMCGVVWALGTPEMRHFRKDFIAQSQYWLSLFHANHPILFNLVDERNTEHIRWLKWLGCKILRRHPHWGRAQLPFLEFVHVCVN